MEYKAIYKCRLCGEVFHTITASEELAQDTMEEFTNAYHGTAPIPCWPTETHRCGGNHAGSMGLADFLGWSNANEPMAYYKAQAAKKALENIARRADV